ALVIERDVRTDLLPALTAVDRLVQVLAADVDLVVIVRRDVERRVPDEAVLQIRRDAVRVVGPHFDVAALPPALFVAHDDAADAAGAGGGGPDDVRVDRIGRREAALAAVDGMPHAAWNAAAPTAAAATAALVEAAVARSAVRGSILLVRVDVVRNLVVDGDVIELRVLGALFQPRPAARLRDRHALVVRDNHAVAVGRIDPHVVVIAARRLQTLGADQRR